jgi:hypothetical protein
MERKDIIRRDFPSARRGYDRKAVEMHLRELADRIEGAESGQGQGSLRLTSLAETASEKVTSIIKAAEQTAAELEREARQQAEEAAKEARAKADQELEAARTQAEKALAEARAGATERINRAEQAVEGLVEEAEALRERIAALGQANAAASQVQLEVDPQGPPTPAESPAPPAPDVDPTPAEVPEPETPDEAPPGPEPVPEPTPEPDHPDDVPPAAEGSDNGDSGARLVAMNMALDGSSREDVQKHLASKFGIEDASKLLDDVFSRVGK